MAVRRILVIHDDPVRAARLALELREDGYTMETAAGADGGLAAPFDRVIVDGETLYEGSPGPCPWEEWFDVGFPPIRLRSRSSDLVVVLAVTPNDGWPPPAPAVPRARVLQAVAEDADLPTGVVVIGDVRLDHRSRQVHLRADEVRLGAAEFEVLALLMEHAGRLVTRADLLQRIWPDDGRRPSRAPDAYIASLRRKLDHPVNVPSHISTIRGIGYLFETG